MCLSFVEPSTSLDVVIIPHLVNHLVNFVFLWLGNEVLEESGHLRFADDSISVEVVLLEEPVELGHGWCWLVVLPQEVLQEVHGLSLVQVIAAIVVVEVPGLVDLLTDVSVAHGVWLSLDRGVVSPGFHEDLEESSHLVPLNETVSILVKFVEESMVSLHVWSWLTLGCAKVFEEVGGLDLVQGTASVGVVLEPDLVDLVSNGIKVSEVGSSVVTCLWPILNLSSSLRGVHGWSWDSWLLGGVEALSLLGVVEHHVIQLLLSHVDRGVQSRSSAGSWGQGGVGKV